MASNLLLLLLLRVSCSGGECTFALLTKTKYSLSKQLLDGARGFRVVQVDSGKS